MAHSSFGKITFAAIKFLRFFMSQHITSSKQLTPFRIMLMAVAAGVSVANIYYNQPVLKDIADEFHASEQQAGIISMLAQIGYGMGLFFITPLGDKWNKKRLIVGLEVALCLSLCLVTVAGSIFQMWALSVLIGLLSVAVQVILPMAAGLDAENRGKTVGTIFTGILIGILAARVFSGAIAEWLNWRWVYGLSSGAVLIITILLWFNLPDVPVSYHGSYPELLKSALGQIKRFSLLRQVSAIGALQFGLFCSFWTTLTFHLSGDPFHFHTDTIGLFGLVAIAGALLAPLFGKKADKGGAKRVQLMAVGFMVSAILLMMIFPSSVVMLVVGVLLLDVGAQAMQVTNVALIYTLDEKSHSRINTIYMTTFFTGGALGTLVGLLCWQYGGWKLVTIQMLVWSLLILVILFSLRKKSGY
jgi:predicted MFS family arabinose efflux permease